MSRRFSFKGKKYSLTAMHSSAGTALFKSLNIGSQKVWAGYDAKRSRNNMKKKIKKGLF